MEALSTEGPKDISMYWFAPENFFSQAAQAPAPGIFFRAAPRGQKKPVPDYWLSLAKHSFPLILLR